MTQATAPAPERQKNGHIHPLLQQFIFAAAVAAVTWALTTSQAGAVNQQRLVAVEKQVESKASKESVEQFQREVLDRLDRIENKLDRADKRGR